MKHRLRGRGIGEVGALTALLAGLIVTGLLVPIPSAVAVPCDEPANEIVAENCLPGNPSSEWDISGAGSTNIQGFATDISVDKGQTVSFKISTASADYRLDIYRMGYYGGMGARKVTSVEPSALLPQTQPTCLLASSRGPLDCGNWAVSATWGVPVDATSGIYFAKLEREDGTLGTNHIFFIVRDDEGSSELLFQTSDTTWQAYNRYGGDSLYCCPGLGGRAYKVSYNRPFITRGCCAADWVFNAEYPMVRWLEANGYDVSYFTGVDAARFGSEILEHDVYLSVGHDEYWSGEQRANVEAARDAGVDLAFFSGNEVFWKTRWENSIDGTATAHRTLVSYKETHANRGIDPTSTWTGTWRDMRFMPHDGGRPGNQLTGALFMVNGPRSDAIEVPAEDGQLRFWRDTSVATLTEGVYTTPTGTLGYEWDEDRDNGFRPAGLIRMSSTTINVPGYLKDFGSEFGSGTATHHLTLYRDGSALVFGAGTIQWSWGLDGEHDRGTSTPDLAMQQATVNLLADMGVQPASLQAGLVTASASTDTTAPTSEITAPADGFAVTTGDVVTITGTASDTGGGVVGGVEVSTDGGATWHPATGRESWTYEWIPDDPGPMTLESRATDDSGNLETGLGSPSGTVAPRNCPCAIWPASATPTQVQVGSTAARELGVRFTVRESGFITGIRFYKGPNNTGTHTGKLWHTNGTLLGSVTFTGETASGWQEASFASPVEVTAGNTYVASYHTDAGRWSQTIWDLSARERRNWPFTVPFDYASGRNGVFKKGTSGFPKSGTSTEGINYWVDVVFDTTLADDDPPTVTSTSPTDGATEQDIAGVVTATFSEAIQESSLSFELRDQADQLVDGAVGYDSASRTATFDPSANLAEGTTYTASVSATDLDGNAMASPATWSFTTFACPCSLWTESDTPAVVSAAATDPHELGVKFKSSVDGFITGIRFYKASDNTGTHLGHLWTIDGTQLAEVTFENETASGWQQATFSTPVPVTAGTVYVASYVAPNGHYSHTRDYFLSSGWKRGPLEALRDGESGGNGVYFQGGSAFPTLTARSRNYWVDVVFVTSVPPG